MQVQQRTEDSGGALAAVVWFAPQHVTVLSRVPGPRPGPDPLMILVVRRQDGGCATVALPASIRPAFVGLERAVVLHHAAALRAFVRSALSGLVLRPGDRKSLAAVAHGPNPAKLGTMRVFGAGVGYDLCELDMAALPDATA